MRIPLLLLALALPATAQAQTKALPKNPGKEPLATPAETAPAHEAAVNQALSDPKLAEIMEQIDSRTPLPSGATGSYQSYYAWADRNRRMVTGVWLKGAASSKWIDFDDLPMVLGGGCDVVTLVWDTEADEARDVACNPR